MDYRGEKETTDLEVHYTDSTNKLIVLRVHERVINSLSRYFQTLVVSSLGGERGGGLDGCLAKDCLGAWVAFVLLVLTLSKY